MEGLPGATPSTRWALGGAFAGGAALVASWFFLEQIVQVPFGGIGINLILVLGLMSALVLGQSYGCALQGGLLVSMTAGLALALSVGRFLPRIAQTPVWMTHTVALPVLLVLAAGSLWAHLATRNREAAAWTVLITCLLAILSLGGFYLHRTGASWHPGALVALAGVTTSVLLAAQFIGLRRHAKPRMRWLAEPGALTLAATQLFDGVVTYLGVINPLGWAPTGLVEQMRLSAFILDTAGPLYPIIKWALGGAIYLALRPNGLWTPKRVGLFLLLANAGLGPGIYSASNLLP